MCESLNMAIGSTRYSVQKRHKIRKAEELEGVGTRGCRGCLRPNVGRLGAESSPFSTSAPGCPNYGHNWRLVHPSAK